jgi:hypothetical protein
MVKQRKKHDCGCSGHPSGRPKYGTGPCYGYGTLRPAVRDRIDGKKSIRAWRRAVDLDDVDD